MYQGLYSSQSSNRWKTTMLIALFPLFLFLILFAILYFVSWKDGQTSSEYFQHIFSEVGAIMAFLVPLLFIWLLISFFFQRKMIFSFTGAKPIDRKQEPEIYNIVENLCISRGIMTPQIGIIESNALNAFALWWKPENAWVVFTRGLLNHLDKKEIEAVAAHELTHILNKDSLLMMVMILYIWIVTLLGQILIRTGSRGSNKNNPLPMIGIGLLILGYLFYPLLKLAISRKREYLADAGSVELTKDNQAMISALQKISGNSLLPLKNENTSMLFIGDPLPLNSGFSSYFSSIFASHPDVKDRIKALQHY